MVLVRLLYCFQCPSWSQGFAGFPRCRLVFVLRISHMSAGTRFGAIHELMLRGARQHSQRRRFRSLAQSSPALGVWRVTLQICLASGCSLVAISIGVLLPMIWSSAILRRLSVLIVNPTLPILADGVESVYLGLGF